MKRLKLLLAFCGALVSPVLFGQITAPFTESFATNSLPTGWTNTNASGSTNANTLWEWGNASSNSPGYNLGSTADHTAGGGGYYAWSDGSTPIEPKVTLMTDSIDVSGLTSPWLEFYILSDNTTNPGDNNTFYVDFYDGTNWNDSIYGRAADDPNWIQVELDLSTYTISGKVLIRFNVDQTTATTAFYNDILLDDITLKEKPTCPNPANLVASNPSSSSIDLSWTTGGSTSWEVEYGSPGFTVGTGTRVGVTTNPYTLTSLSANTTYDAWVRDSCGPADVSLWIGPVAFTTNCQTQMAGTYSLDPSQATGGTNFNSFVDVAAQLNSCGVSGAVEINVSPGTHNDHLVLGDIVGASSVNTITFNGGDSALTTITYSSTVDTPTIFLNGADWVTIKNMTIENTSTADAWGVFLMNGADHNTIDSCAVKMPSSTTTDLVGIVSSASIATDNTSGNNANYLTVSNCFITGGEKGIHLYGDVSNLNAGHRIINCSFDDHDDDGIHVNYQDSIEISGCYMTSAASTYRGMNLDDVSNFTVTANEVLSPDIGIAIDDANDVNVPAGNSLVANNMLIGQTDDGLYLDDVEYINIYHNSIVGEPGIRFNDQVNLDIRNNIFVSQSSFALQSVDALGSGDILDYNVYNSNGNNLASVGGTNHSDLAAFKASLASFNANSFEGDPLFTSATDLHVTGNIPNDAGDSTLGITTDIDGDIRPQAPSTRVDIGADEYSITGCFAPFNISVSNVSASSATVSWATGGATSWELEYGAPGFTIGTGTRIGTTTSNYSITNLALTTTYEVWVRDSCGAGNVSSWAGPVTFTTLCAQMAGTYTINPAQVTGGTNFVSFADAASELNSCGVSAPVIINVASGTHLENFVLNVIPGASSVNTITIDGGDSALTTLTYSSTSDTPTVFLNGADWVTIKNMTIRNTSSSDAWGVFLMNGADNNTIDSCAIIMPSTTTTDVAGIVSSGSLATDNTAGNNANYLTVSNCFITGGEKGIHLYGDVSNFNTGNRIINCSFADHDDDGIHVNYQDSLEISGCYMTSAASTYRGMNLDDVSNFTVTANEVLSSDIGMAIDDANDVSVPSGNSLLANNMLVGQSDDGLYLDDVEYINIYHNSVLGEPGIRLNDQVNLDMRNNVFTSQSGYALESVDALGSADSLDYNVYNTAGANLLRVGGTDYVDLPAFVLAAPSYNANSWEGDPIFTSLTDLHLQGIIANDVGDSTLGIIVDIDGDARPLSPATRVDIGADEYLPPSCVQPINLSASNITDSSATISWMGGGATSWNIEYGPSGFTQGTGTAFSTSSNPHNLNGLPANMAYDFYVQDSCSDGSLSTWAGPFTFKTLCNSSPITLPFFDGFENYSGTYQSADYFCGLNYRWDYSNSATGGRLRFNAGPAFYQNGVAAATLDRSAGGTITNYMTLTLDMTNYIGQTGVILGFSHMHHGEESHANDRVWIRGSDTATWVEVYNLFANQGSAGTYNTVTIASGINLSNELATANQAFSSTFQIRFGQQDNSNASSATGVDGRSFDDINIQQLVCFPSANLTVHQTTQDSALVSWTAGTGVAWHIEYGAAGFAQGQGAGTVVTSTNDSLWITGLQAGTQYDFYVSDSCSGNAGNSIWSGPETFSTQCNRAPVILPFTEDFESYNGSHSTATFFCNNNIQWDYSNSANGGRLRFNAGTGFYLSGSRAATLDRSAGGTIINYMILTMDMSNYEDSLGIFMSFNHMHHGEESHGNDRVWIRGSDTANWIQVYNLFANQGAAGVYHSVSGQSAIDLSTELAAAGQDFSSTFQIRFGQQDNSAATSLTGIDGRTFDDITVYKVPCPDPATLSVSNVTGTGADLHWSSNASNWNVEWGPLGFSQGSQAVGSTRANGVTTNPYTVTNLSPNTWYDFYVQDSCSGGLSYWVGPFSFKTPCLSALSGTYTIGGLAGPNNFADFDSAAFTLNSCGISGPVLFNVQPGVYMENLQLDTIVGSSAVNTITFDGGSAATTTIIFISTNDIPTVYLNGTDWVTIKNMTIENTGIADAWGVFLRNGADHNTIDSCEIKVPATTATDVAGIVASSSLATDNSGGSNTNFLTVSNCTITGGEKAIHLYGDLNNFNVGNRIINCSIDGHDDDGIHVNFQDSIEISGNYITSTAATYRGINMDDVSNFSVTANEIISPDIGMAIDDANDVTVPVTSSLVANNMFVGQNDDGLYLDDVEYINIYHNSIIGAPGIRLNDQVDLDIRNNIFFSHTSTAFESVDALGSGDSLDYNVYYSNGANVASVNSTNYSDLASWKAGLAAFNVNSLEGDPLFATATDLHLIGTLANDVGDNSVGITVDFDGDARPLAPSTIVDIGADEYAVNADDVSAMAIIDPTNGVCADSNAVVRVIVQNLGVNSITGFNVYADISGAATANLNMTYTGTLNSLDQDTVTLSSFNTINGGIFDITASVSHPNDQSPGNDTIQSSVSIVDGLPPIPTVALDSVCSGGYDTLFFPGNVSSAGFEWRTVTGLSLGYGDSLLVGPMGTNDTTFVLATDTARFSVGPDSNGIGTGANHSNHGARWLNFTVYQTMTIDSVAVYPNGGGNVVVNLHNSGAAAPTQVISSPVPGSAAGVKTMIPVGITVGPGSYELRATGSTTGGLYRNNGGVNFPYGIHNVVDITSSNNGVNHYFYFYDWKISVGSCPRADGTITIYNNGIGPSASFTSTPGVATISSLPVAFDASTSTGAVSSYSWDFGDGNFGTGATPTHNYSNNGTYTVRLVVDGACGTDTITDVVVIQGISLYESGLSQGLIVYPNPVKGQLNIALRVTDLASLKLILMDVSGREVYREEHDNINGQFNHKLDLKNLPNGVYILEVESNSMKERRRIIKD